MRRERGCHRGGPPWGGPCSCEMGNVYRFAEPVVLLALAKLGTAHGYQIVSEAQNLAVTHAGLDSGIVYRTLRRLEDAGHLVSTWDVPGHGPARRVYVMTPLGWDHLRDWAVVVQQLASSLQRLAEECRSAAGAGAGRSEGR